MPVHPPPPDVATLSSAARHWSQHLRRSLALARIDQDDGHAAILIEVLSRWSRFDPARSSPRTFADRLARTAGIALIREARSLKRGGGTSEEEVGDHLPAGAYPDVDLVREVQAAVAALPEQDRRVCAVLADLPVATAARELGMSRAALRRRLARIRAHFEAAGLDAWLEAA